MTFPSISGDSFDGVAPPKIQVEFWNLLAKLREGDCDALDVSRLESLTGRYPALLEVFVRHAELHAALDLNCGKRQRPAGGAAAGAEAEQEFPGGGEQVSVGKRAVWSWRQQRRASLVAGIMAVVLLMAILSQLYFPGSRPRAPGVAAAAAPRAAKFMPLNVCRDASGNIVFEDRDLFADDRLELTEGTAMLSFACGSELFLQGPCSLILGTERMPGKPSLAHFMRGRAVVRVPQHAVGFTLRTPHCDVIDLGTEFSVNVKEDDGEGTGIFVFEGAVRVALPEDGSAPPDANGDSPRRGAVVKEGSRARADGRDIEITPAAGDAHGFLRWSDVEPELVAKDYVQSVAASRPLAYWRLNEENVADGAAAKDSLGNYHGVYRGEVASIAGPAPLGSRAIAFDGETAYVELGALGEFAAGLERGATIEFWLRHREEREMRQLFGSITTESSTLVIDLNRDANLRPASGATTFYVRERQVPLRAMSGSVSEELAAGGPWRHVVWVIDSPSRGEQRVYIDGRLQELASVVEGRLPDQFTAFAYPLVLGAANDRGEIVKHSRADVCELAIYPRRLSGAEVLRHWRAARGE